MNQYVSLYDFCTSNRVECTQGDNGIYNCYINYTKEDNRPWGNGKHCLDAIENAVINYMRWHSQRSFSTAAESKPEDASHDAKELIDFFNTGGRIFKYWFAIKHDKDEIADQYEYEALTKNPELVDKMQSLVECIEATIKDINFKISERYPAVHNPWIQAIVYYESPSLELYENNSFIRDLVNKLGEKDKNAFYEMQKELAKFEDEILKVDE
jgi:hypothetical protein